MLHYKINSYTGDVEYTKCDECGAVFNFKAEICTHVYPKKEEQNKPLVL